jgi:hypothetical protein
MSAPRHLFNRFLLAAGLFMGIWVAPLSLRAYTLPDLPPLPTSSLPMGNPANFAEVNLDFPIETNGFSSDWVNALCEDREGNLWVGTGNGGLAMLRTVNVKTLTPPDQWQGRAVLGIAVGADGALWVGTEGAGLYGFHEGNWTNYDVTSGLMHYLTHSGCQAGRGRI